MSYWFSTTAVGVGFVLYSIAVRGTTLICLDFCSLCCGANCTLYHSKITLEFQELLRQKVVASPLQSVVRKQHDAGVFHIPHDFRQHNVKTMYKYKYR